MRASRYVPFACMYPAVCKYPARRLQCRLCGPEPSPPAKASTGPSHRVCRHSVALFSPVLTWRADEVSPSSSCVVWRSGDASAGAYQRRRGACGSTAVNSTASKKRSAFAFTLPFDSFPFFRPRRSSSLSLVVLLHNDSLYTRPGPIALCLLYHSYSITEPAIFN